MDLSALIFVALAVAWAVYLIPMALKHSDDAARSRSVDRFSGSLRVLARREPVDARRAALVVSGAEGEKGGAAAPGGSDVEPGEEVVVEAAPKAAGPDKIRVRRAVAAPPPPSRSASAVAARRRRRVLGTVVLANVALVALATASVVPWPFLGLTLGLLVAWLVACRLMVKQERRAPARRPAATPATAESRPTARPARRPAPAAETDDGPATEDLPAVRAEVAAPAVTTEEAAEPAAAADPDAWDLRPTPLPTYVGKATASRTVRTIDLDSTGVWSSGRNADDSEIAREADEAARAAKSDREATERRRATGS